MHVCRYQSSHNDVAICSVFEATPVYSRDVIHVLLRVLVVREGWMSGKGEMTEIYRIMTAYVN